MAMQDSDPNLTSKKRTRPSSFTPIFTRHKSQFYLHRNRSGRTRSDSCLNQKVHINPPESIAKRCRKRSENADDDWSRILIRDLRTRRVFSPGSSIQNECEKDGIGGVVTSDVFIVKDDVILRENGGIKEPKNGDLNVNAENVKDGVLVAEGFENRFGGLKEEECLQSTPPDTEMMFGCRIVGNEGEVGSKLKANVNAEKMGEVFQGNVEKKNGNGLGNKFILSPCSRSRVRVFKAPGSFSYRRLLPFLVDMARESSRVERKIDMEDQKLPPIDQCQADCTVAKNQSDISAHLSPKPAIEEMQRIEVEESEKDDNLQNMSPECPPQSENMMSDSSDEPMPAYNKEAEKINVEPSCSVEFRSDTVQELYLKSEKDLHDRDEEACNHDNDEARSVGCKPAKKFETADPCISLSDSIEKKDENVGGNQGESANSNEELIQLAQTVVEIKDNAGVNKNTNTRTGNAIDSSNNLPQNPADRIILSNNAGKHVKLDASNLNGKLGLSPCAKLKRFKTPSSFSYKRMLPYLMEITKDGSGDSGSTHSLDSREVNQPLMLSSDIRGNPFGKQNTNCSHEMQISTDTATIDASDSNWFNQISADQVNKISVSFKSQEQESPAKIAGPGKEKQHLSAVVWGGYTPSIEHPQCAKALEVSSISQNSSLLRGTDPLRIPKCSRKSILKRNPRGCRGLCNCLNCASFRLHAERAFEFSKYQMQDAEEIALNLVWELSQLRNILEKTASSDAISGVICSNQLHMSKACMDSNNLLQVKEACKKASEAEELAKGRLSEMIYDLNVHCRIPCSQPPRVTFAIDERLVSGALQSKSEENTIN